MYGKVGNDLFDIGKNMDNVVGREKAFYMDQLPQRECRLSEEIDIDFEKSQEQMRQDEEECNSFVDPEEFKEVITPKKPHIFESDTSQSSSTCDTSTNPKVVRKEIKKPLFDRPEIRKSRNFLPLIKETITTVSHKVAISVEKARLAVQATCKKLYNH